MGTYVETKLQIKSWEEQPYLQLEDGRKFTRASVVLSGSQDDFHADATWDALMYYAPDGTSSYVGLMHVTGRLGDRTGSFVLQGSGTYDGTQASGESHVVPGSGTGDLAGLRGTSRSVSTHADYPYMPLTLDYEIA
ncbi:MAG TPA: DUF3224 domain-containing protein [Micromonosporaceae bacterium]